MANFFWGRVTEKTSTIRVPGLIYAAIRKKEELELEDGKTLVNHLHTRDMVEF